MSFSLLLWMTLLGAARADALSDLTLAANTEVPEAQRQAAFDRVVDMGRTDMSAVLQLAQNPDTDMNIRWVAIRALGKIGGPRTHQLLPALMRSESAPVRAAGVSAAGDLRDRQHTEQAVALLQDPAIMVRASAAEALGKIGDPKAIDALAAALTSDSSYYRGSSLWVRRHYVMALGEIGHRKSYAPLMLALGDVDANVVSEAIISLENISGQSFSEGRNQDQQVEAWQRWLSSIIAQ